MHFWKHIYDKNEKLLEHDDGCFSEEKVSLALMKTFFLIDYKERKQVLESLFDFLGMEEDQEIYSKLFLHENEYSLEPEYIQKAIEKKATAGWKKNKQKRSEKQELRYLEYPRAALLKELQKKIQKKLEALFIPPENVFGFVKGRSHYDNACFHANQRPNVVLSIDIKDFFGTTSFVQLYSGLKNLLSQHNLEEKKIEELTQGILLVCTVRRKGDFLFLAERTLLIQILRFFNALYFDKLLMNNHKWKKLRRSNQYKNKLSLKERSRKYALLLRKIFPKKKSKKIDALRIEQILHWLIEDRPIPNLYPDKYLLKIKSWFEKNEPYSWVEFRFFKEIIIVGIALQLGDWKLEKISRENLLCFAFSLLGQDWKAIQHKMNGQEQDFFVCVALFLLLEKKSWHGNWDFIEDYFGVKIEGNEHCKTSLEKWWLDMSSTKGRIQQIEKILLLKDILEPIWNPVFEKMRVIAYTSFHEKSQFYQASCSKPASRFQAHYYYRYLPQGAPTSPILSNIALLCFDQKMSEFAKEHQLLYSRYADDLNFSGQCIPKGFVGNVGRSLERHYYRINRSKTSVRTYFQHQEVNGLVVSDGYVRINMRYYRWLRAELYYLGISQKNNQEINQDKMRSLRGHLAYLQGVDERRYQKLKQEFSETSLFESV